MHLLQAGVQGEEQGGGIKNRGGKGYIEHSARGGERPGGEEAGEGVVSNVEVSTVVMLPSSRPTPGSGRVGDVSDDVAVRNASLQRPGVDRLQRSAARAAVDGGAAVPRPPVARAGVSTYVPRPQRLLRVRTFAGGMTSAELQHESTEKGEDEAIAPRRAFLAVDEEVSLAAFQQERARGTQAGRGPASRWGGGGSTWADVSSGPAHDRGTLVRASTFAGSSPATAMVSRGGMDAEEGRDSAGDEGEYRMLTEESDSMSAISTDRESTERGSVDGARRASSAGRRQRAEEEERGRQLRHCCVTDCRAMTDGCNGTMLLRSDARWPGPSAAHRPAPHGMVLLGCIGARVFREKCRGEGVEAWLALQMAESHRD
jgi:hypothetical protein